MPKLRLLVAAATLVGTSLLLAPAGLTGQANAATADTVPVQHCTETNNFDGAVIEMCFVMDFVPSGFDGYYYPFDVRVTYGGPSWLMGNNDHFGIPSFTGCVVDAEIYTQGTDQLVATSPAYWCANWQTSQSPYEPQDGPEEDEPDALAYHVSDGGTVAVAYHAAADDPPSREIDIPDSGTYRGALPLMLPVGNYCVALVISTEFEPGTTRNNPACFYLG